MIHWWMVQDELIHIWMVYAYDLVIKTTNVFIAASAA